MLADVRRKVMMAAQVVDFMTINPATDSGIVAVVAQLAADVARGNVLIQQQRDGLAGEHAAVVGRKAIRRDIHSQRLHHLVHVALTAQATHPELVGNFTLPRGNAARIVYMNAVKGMLAAATAQKELLVSYGLGETFLDDFTKAIAAFDSADVGGAQARLDHVGARAELNTLADECIRLARTLDGFNQLQYQDNPQLLAAWNSALKSQGGFRGRRRSAAPAEPAPVAPPVAPSSPLPVAPTNGGDSSRVA